MKFFLHKTVVLLMVFFLVQIPLYWTEGLNNERSNFKKEATATVSKSYAGRQSISGPILVFPYTHAYWQDVVNNQGNPIGREQKFSYGSISLLPKKLSIINNVTAEERKIGIFPVPVFKAEVQMMADFAWKELVSGVVLKPDDTLEWGQAFIALPISDQHGIKIIQKMRWEDKDLAYTPGSRVELFDGKGLYANVPARAHASEAQALITVEVVGTEMLQNIPTAEQTTVTTQSNWPHPQFLGAQLPDTREVSENGFSAIWQSTALASNINTLWQKCFTTNECQSLENESLGVQLIDPTNFYAKMTRALKYGFLFLAITFIAFLLFEVLCDLRIHPVQYAFLGVAAGVFFILLLSFAEHIGFTAAYAAAASACLLLLSVYAHALLKHWRRTLSFSAVLAVLYLVLYTILQQEDAALLTGSVLIFTLLAIAMMSTRKIDWYVWQDQLAKPTI